MKQSANVSAPTHRAHCATRNECAFAGRSAVRQSQLCKSNARRSLKPETVTQIAQARRAEEHKQAVPTRGVSMLSRNYFRSRKKILAQLKTKTSYQMANAALSRIGHGYAVALNAE